MSEASVKRVLQLLALWSALEVIFEHSGAQHGAKRLPKWSPKSMPNSIFFENALKWRLGRASGRYRDPFGAHLGPILERFGHDSEQILQDEFDRKKYLRHTACTMQQLKEPSKKLQNLPQTSKDDIFIHRPTSSYRRRNRRPVTPLSMALCFLLATCSSSRYRVSSCFRFQCPPSP